MKTSRGAEGLAVRREIEQPPVVSVFPADTRGQVEHPLDGFGVLVPQVEHRQMLGTLFSSTLFPGRAPVGPIGFTTSVGGVRDAPLTQRDDPRLLRVAQGEWEHCFGVLGAPVYRPVQRWPRAIPGHTPGYQRFKDANDAVEAATRGTEGRPPMASSRAGAADPDAACARSRNPQIHRDRPSGGSGIV